MSVRTAPTSTGPTAELPPYRSATEPPEARGLARDEVRLLVATPTTIHHARFRDLGTFLDPGDLLVVNTSATLPAAVDGTGGDGRPVVIHVAGPHPADDGTWLVELRRPDGHGPQPDGRVGEVVAMTGEVPLTLLAPHAVTGDGVRLWRAATPVAGARLSFLQEHGRPVAYGYLSGRWPLEAYQTVFSREPGSAEMPSAARPFTHGLVTDLATRGVTLAPVLLHTGVSSLEDGEDPPPERFRVTVATARLVNATRAAGGRVVAVGTTVARALESVAEADGRVRAGTGWTGLVLEPQRPAVVVDGLVTGWHAPGASHLRLLEAVAGADLVDRAYRAALDADYRWHEFGDSCLLLP